VPVDTLLRLLYLKHLYGLGYETLCKEVSDSIGWRRFEPALPLAGFHYWFTARYTVLPCLPDPGRLAVPTRSVVVRAALTLPGASQAGLPSASARLLRQPSGGSFHPTGHTAPRGAPPCPCGPCPAGCAAGPTAFQREQHLTMLRHTAVG
jgi:Transposase domain (DUF772)